MNIYRSTFTAICPNDGEVIIYSLEIHSLGIIYVEHINTATALIKKGIQEQIADSLHATFGGELILKAVHQGVEIESLRKTL